MIWAIRKGGAVYACGDGPHGYTPEVLRAMASAGYYLYIDGKRQKVR